MHKTCGERTALAESTGVLVEADCFDLEQIMESGQCFRIHREQELYRATASDKTVLIREICLPDRHKQYEFFCTREEYDTFWHHYFDLDTDYRSYQKAIDPNDSYLSSAFACGSGIRILNQKPWEMLITFIISQRKNIPAIRQAVEGISRSCGSCIDEQNQIYAFPTPDQLAALSLEQLQALSLGYRAKYIYEAAKKTASGELCPDEWNRLGDEELHKALLSCYGVGEKVANCVALFGYHRIGAFPVDVWIDRIQKKYYNGHFPAENYLGFAGVMQQYMFYYERKMTEKLS